MPEEWLDVSYINFDKAILHGRVTDGYDKDRVRKEREIEQVLTDEQMEALSDLSAEHDLEKQKLLRSFVVPA